MRNARGIRHHQAKSVSAMSRWTHTINSVTMQRVLPLQNSNMPFVAAKIAMYVNGALFGMISEA